MHTRDRARANAIHRAGLFVLGDRHVSDVIIAITGVIVRPVSGPVLRPAGAGQFSAKRKLNFVRRCFRRSRKEDHDRVAAGNFYRGILVWHSWLDPVALW